MAFEFGCPRCAAFRPFSLFVSPALYRLYPHRCKALLCARNLEWLDLS